MLMRTLILLLGYCFFSASLQAQRYSFKNYTTHDGLVQTEITDITQDKRGAIWIATRGGISVFDGQRFVNFDSQDVLQNLYINSLLCDSSGVVWVATDNGLLKYDHAFHVFFKSGPGPKNSVTSLATNSRNQLFFVCNNAAYQTDGQTTKPYPIDKAIDGKVELLAVDRSDNLWIVTKNFQVYRKSGRDLKMFPTPFKPELIKQGLGVMKILGKKGPTPYFVTNFGTLCLKNDSLCFFSYLHPAFSKAKVGAAMYVLPDGDSTLWVGGTMGLAKLHGDSVTRFAEYNGFCDNSVSSLFIDRERNVWIGCTFNGVYKLSNEALFQLKPNTTSFDLRHVSDMSTLPSGELLLATWGRGLFLAKGDSIAKLSTPNGMVNYITCLQQVGSTTVFGWFGKGLWQMNNATHKIYPVRGFAEDVSVWGMNKVGDKLLIQTLDHRCYLTNEQFEIKTAVQIPDDYSVMAIGNRICGMNMSGYVEALDSNLRAIRKNIFPQINSRITSLVAYRNYTLVGTFGQGLFVYNDRGELVKRMDKTTGLYTNIVASLLVDGNRLFIGSNLGLIKADLPNFQHVKLFTENEGMFTWECRPNGLRKLPDGGLAIATTNGPYLYYPDKDSPEVWGQVTVSDFSFGAKHNYFSPVSNTHSLHDAIAYGDNNITVSLKGISQRNPDAIVYHYQLQGYDTAWVTTTDSVMHFDNLVPGTYRFGAYISIGGFRSKPLSVLFSVAKPVTGRLWFQVLLVLVFSVICWALLTIGNRIYQRYIQSRMLSRLEKDVAGKQQLTTDSVRQTGRQFDALNNLLSATKQGKETEKLTSLLLLDISRRTQILWQRDEVLVMEIHRYFDELITSYGNGAKIYHKEMAGENVVPVLPAFHLLQLFSLYAIVSLAQNSAAAFSLDSETKSNGRLLLRFYTIKATALPNKNSVFQFLKEAIEKQKPDGVVVDVIENLEFGNMLVAELNLQNEYA